MTLTGGFSVLGIRSKTQDEVCGSPSGCEGLYRCCQRYTSDLSIIRSSMTYCHSKVRMDNSLLASTSATALFSLHTLPSSMRYPLTICLTRPSSFLSLTRTLFKYACLSMSALSCSITPSVRWLRKIYAQPLRGKKYWTLLAVLRRSRLLLESVQS